MSELKETDYTDLHEKEEEDKNKIPEVMAYCYRCNKDTKAFIPFIDIYLCDKCIVIIRKLLLDGHKEIE
ncbi:MAG: hypothetical protein HeimC3_40890 [Candidatus Heimdallarchaeota archaeon LC_3]|nr:MAG: hypothetical protein HeimC3_40890 [Candidatus Heimdallarchaeota archaeon LC_3]